MNKQSPAPAAPPGVMLYRHFYTALSALDHETVGRLTMALMEYAFFGAEPQLPPALSVAWTFLKNYADRDANNYRHKVTQRRTAAEKRWQEGAGKKTKKPVPDPAPNPAPATEDTEPVYGGLRPYRDENGIIRYK